MQDPLGRVLSVPCAARCWGIRELVQVFEQKSAMVRCKVFTVSLAWRRGDRWGTEQPGASKITHVNFMRGVKTEPEPWKPRWATCLPGRGCFETQ